MPALQGKIAVITGGSSGIGLATAKRFVKEGAYVFITGRRQAELDKAVAEVGSNVTAVQGDASSLDDLDRLYNEADTRKGKLDVLFANAGITEPKPTAAVSADDHGKTFDINARGVFFAAQKALPLMKHGGSIILTGSGLWQKGIPIYAVRSYQGGFALVCAHLDGGVGKQRNPNKYDQPRPRRYTWSHRSTWREHGCDEGSVQDDDPDGANREA
jgi:NAD(P)-dependent dehydrogenase (short-subunit alcohol dehydrogenase family)